jgi:hypothetical protein
MIGLSWAAVTPPANCTISSYNVYSSTTSGLTPSSSNLIASGLTATSYTSTGLAASTPYYYIVEALDADGTSTVSAQAVATTQSSGVCSAVPAAPTGLTATESSSSSIALSWTAVQPPANCSVSSYSVYRGTTSGFIPSSSNRIASGVAGTTYSNTGLTASTTYYYVVEAVDADGSSVSSAQTSATTVAASCAAVPSAPAGLTATATSSSAIGLNWTAVTPPANCTISGYSVYGSSTSGFTPGSGNLITSGLTATSYSNTNLQASTTYYYVVEAVDADGASAAPAQVSATTQPSSITPITSINSGGPAVSNSGGGDNSFIADEDFSGGGTYSVTNTITIPAGVASIAAPAAVYQSARQGTTTYAIPGLTVGTSYTVRLHFAELYFSAAGNREFDVTINGTTVLTNFDIFAAANANYTAVVEQFAATANSSGDIVIAFTNGAKDQPMFSGIEVLGSAAGSCTSVPSSPAGLTANGVSSTAINLNWAAVTPPPNCSIGSYSIYRGTTSGFTPGAANLIASGVASTTYSSIGLNASTTYYYIVEAVDADGASAASAQATATTQSPNTEFVAIACGGPAESNSGGGDDSFVVDEDFSGGGDNNAVTATINLTQPGANAAPMGVYQHGRAGVSTYTIPGLAAGSQHSVLLHFAETYFTATGDREFNVAINGTTVLTNLDIYATVGKNAALLEAFIATANSSGQIVIAFTTGSANQPLVMGIEIR